MTAEQLTLDLVDPPRPPHWSCRRSGEGEVIEEDGRRWVGKGGAP